MDYDIAEVFRRIELELISSMKRNWKRHNEEENKYGFTWSRWQAEQLKSLEEFKKKNPRLFSSEFKAINEQFLDSILGQKETNFFGVHSRKVQALVKATTGDLVKAEHAMLRKANDEYRKVIYNAQTYLASGAGTLDKAIDMASNDFLTRGINCVVYKGGRHVNMATYSEMSLRTTNKRIGMYADGAKRQELGVHTVKVSKYGMCSKTCQPWQGRVYVDDVYSGGTPEEAEELNLPLLSTAISGGLFHPNCKHHLSTYYPGMDNDDDGDPRQLTYENPPGTQEHHYLQHQIQRERRLQVGSLSEDKIREHADKEQQLIGLDEKYVKQVEQYDKERFMAIRDGEMMGANLQGDYKDIPTEVLQGVDKALHNLIDKEIPSLKNGINEIFFKPMSLKNLMSTKNLDSDLRSVLNINSNYFSNAKAIEKISELNYTELSPKKTLEDYLKHELCHVLEDKYNIRINTDSVGIPNVEKIINDCNQHTYATELLDEALEKCGLNKSDEIISKYISKYATYTDSEAVAEAFSSIANNKVCNTIKSLVKSKWIGGKI
ncbi:phage minor capsid protein [uncultured Solobacterium sp.]|uniref:phage minor capsid protein n=1 Tax=uncultured Solobacterium sp. TaxID=747375 RepID=UPI0028EF4EFE|nr:phage minor capsid protein [uncultured Solobacterium sp.]